MIRDWWRAVRKPVGLITGAATLLMTLFVYMTTRDNPSAQEAGFMLPAFALVVGIGVVGIPVFIATSIGATIWHFARRGTGSGSTSPAPAVAPAPLAEPIRHREPIGQVIERGNNPPAQPRPTRAHWLNAPGQRFRTPATIAKAHPFTYGGMVQALAIFRTAAGDLVHWKGAPAQVREGDTGILTATVTAHSLFNGVPQTEVDSLSALWEPGPLTIASRQPQTATEPPQQATTQGPQTPSQAANAPTAGNSPTPATRAPMTPEQLAEAREGVLRNSERQAARIRRDAQRSGAVPSAPLAPVTPAPNDPRKKSAVDLSDPDRLNKVLAELDALPGLESVAAQVRTMAHRVLIAQQRRERGMKVPELGMHALFIGPPGTGKTTVARIWSRALAALGLLPSGHLIETDRSGLVGTHIGHTAPKTNEVIDSAKGGVLFIDEAYALAPEDAARDFGAEAVATLLKRMEDERTAFAVVAAGYEREMERFVASNSGLESRFAQRITFPDFDAEALLSILHRQASEADYVLTPGAETVSQKALVRLAAATPRGWANARSVRGILDAAVSAQSERLAAESELTDEALRTLTEPDVRRALEQRHPQAL